MYQTSSLLPGGGIGSFPLPSIPPISESAQGSHVNKSQNTRLPLSDFQDMHDTVVLRLNHSSWNPRVGNIVKSCEIRTSYDRLCAHTIVRVPFRHQSVIHVHNSSGVCASIDSRSSVVFLSSRQRTAAPRRHRCVSVSPFLAAYASVSNVTQRCGILDA